MKKIVDTNDLKYVSLYEKWMRQSPKAGWGTVVEEDLPFFRNGWIKIK